jgi:hypothetical protein
MNHTQQPTPRMLVIANRTCPCPTLVYEVARRAHDRVELAVGELRERRADRERQGALRHSDHPSRLQLRTGRGRRPGMNRLQQLHQAGVSIWLDTLSRELLDTGAFGRLIGDSAVTGATSNPTIFAKAITGSDRYDDQLREAVASGVRDPQESCSSSLRSTTSAAPPTCCTQRMTPATGVTASCRSNAPPTSPTTRRPRSGKRWSYGAGSRAPM